MTVRQMPTLSPRGGLRMTVREPGRLGGRAGYRFRRRYTPFD